MKLNNVPRSLVKIIDFEGMDASYKETNSNALYEYLKKERYASAIADGKIDVVKLEFPSYDPRRSYFVSEYLHGSYSDRFNIDFILDKEELNKGMFANSIMENQLKLLCSIFFLEMFDWAATVKITKPTIFVLDRYFYSQMYYLSKNIHKIYHDDRNMLLAFVNKVFSTAISMYLLPEADCIIKMSNTFDNMIKTIKERKHTDIYEEDYDYLKSVYDLFNERDSDIFAYCSSYSSHNTIVKNIDVADKDREQVFSEVKSNIESVLKYFDEELEE